MFGLMTVAYSKNDIHVQDQEKQWTMHYQVLEQGKDFVIIRTRGGGFADALKMRIQFVDGGNGYWTDSGRLLGTHTPEEKFDRVTEPDGPANRSQPVGSQTNRTSSAAGSGG
jgi:hypothetical protein